MMEYYKAQKCIVSSLRRRFAGITVIGEEVSSNDDEDDHKAQKCIVSSLQVLLVSQS